LAGNTWKEEAFHEMKRRACAVSTRLLIKGMRAGRMPWGLPMHRESACPKIPQKPFAGRAWLPSRAWRPPQANLARFYSDGWGVPRDDKLAAEWAVKAADQGNASGQILLGWAYIEGKGVRKDAEVAVKWFRLAADKGDVSAAINLGMAYRDGKGVPKDREQAIYWFEKAAEGGSVLAAYNISQLYYWHGWFDHNHDLVNAYAWMLIGQRMKDRVDPQFQPEPKQAHAAEKYSTCIQRR
jgi:TPR repeat protein